MIKHFEELWEESENIFKNDLLPIKAIMMELHAKLSVYEALDAAENLPTEEKLKLKSHTMGKILVSLTQLSIKDNINTFIALSKAIEDAKIENLEIKYRV